MHPTHGGCGWSLNRFKNFLTFMQNPDTKKGTTKCPTFVINECKWTFY